MSTGSWGGVADRHPYQVRIKWLAGTNVQQTGFYLRSTGANVSDPEEIATNVADFVTGTFRTILPTDYRVNEIDVVDMSDRSGFSITPANQFGTIARASENFTPAFLCARVALKSEVRARYGQGGMFFPIIGDGQYDGDLLTATGRANMQGVIDGLVSRYVGGSFAGHSLICLHGVLPARPATQQRPIRPEIPARWYDVQSLRLNPSVTFLRSRKAGVGS